MTTVLKTEGQKYHITIKVAKMCKYKYPVWCKEPAQPEMRAN